MTHALLLLTHVAVPACALRSAWTQKGSAELLSDMRPEIVSGLLSQVEHRWMDQSVKVMRGEAKDEAAYGEMEKSCLKVSRSIVAGSDGDEDRVAEYMKDVCSRAGKDEAMCGFFRSGLDDIMIGDAVYNRQQLNLPAFCKSFWSGPIKDAAVVLKQAQDAEAKAEEEKKAALAKVEEAKRVNATKAAEQKKAAEEKVVAEKKEVEEKAADEKKLLKEKLEKEKKETQRKNAQEAAEQNRAAASAAATKAKEKAENATAKISKRADDEVQKISSAEDDAFRLAARARAALHMATKKESDAQKKNVIAKAPQLNMTKTNTMAASVNVSVAKVEATDMAKDEAKAKIAGDAKADEIVAKVEAKLETKSQNFTAANQTKM